MERTLKFRLGGSAIALGPSWLIVLPLFGWAAGAVYVPIIAPFFNPLESWGVAVAIILLSGLSLLGHLWAHLRTARVAKSDIPPSIPLYLLGDAAHVWPAGATARREALVALAGPAIHLLFAFLAYLVWDAQLDPYLNTITLFLVFFNGGLAVVNLASFYPLDGGRLVRAVGWGLLARPAGAGRLARWLGFLFATGLALWGVILIAQQARFSWPNGLGTLFFAGLILIPLLAHPGWQWTGPSPSKPARWSVILLRGPLAGLFILGLLGLTISLVPTNHGLEAPGIAVAVEPMVEVPAPYRQPVAGRFLLTTVVTQTPITVGEWLFGQISPIINLVPPERIVPADRTVQEEARRNFQMLDDSQLAAIAVGLQLAGYDVEITGLGARILSILPDSPANSLLQPGDVIVGLNGQPIEAAAEVSPRLTEEGAPDSVLLQLERAGEPVAVTVPLMAPSEPGQPPRIGIRIEDAGFVTDLPFPVQIHPQKIVGGPSAGLMFALTVYNLVTPEDLSGGRIIAGTGTISPNGTVGPIGGVRQKVAGAEFAGAEYFLAPPENYEDARAVARRITVVEVATAEEAIQFLQSLPPLP